MKRRHDMPFGAAVQDDGSVRFRLWAPSAPRVDVKFNSGGPGRVLPMRALEGGWYELITSEARPGSRYMFVIDGGPAVPDPASRDQGGDVHGWSIVVDPHAFDWRDDAWRGRPWHETVLYELHVGTFTRAGRYCGVAEKFDALVELGVTAIELMPLSEAPGRFNWGYDGAYLFAPEGSYGQPDDLKLLIEAAHRRGLMVFLDVVYNHFGPEGNYLSQYAAPFFTERHHTPWGAAINYDGADSRVVRDFMVHNALYWLEEYHVDGLRLDAVHAIIDDGAPHILTEIAAAVRRSVAGRHVHLVLENDDNAVWPLRVEEDELGFAAQWNDDIHHALHVAVAKQYDGYYRDYANPIVHLGRALAEGFAYQGEASVHRGGAARGERSRHLPPTSFVSFLQNHDQVGNNATGTRINHVALPEACRAAAAIYILAPSVPLLFMGEEWAASSPFLFFCDFGGELAEAVREGRRAEFAKFAAFQSAEAREKIPDPTKIETFLASRLDWSERERTPHRETLAFYQALLAIRAREVVPRLKGLRGNAAAEFITAGRGGLHAHWTLADRAVLVLRANLSGEAAEVTFEPADGRMLCATHPEPANGAGALPPWFVAWFLRAPS
jgi:malto-oligosyltrehalose trehalohydrolase